ncbi:hypothetical protein LOAG_11855 [Loa loa]|uniref:Uncharacterized protein n=2 Tax=Loa loa TaxID=7209 RepID=A0A1S0TNG7_LOALO|nr:hypothetical protein LOAG_11855 [Loa loa]EFO16649.2 hypothetical protein LOAG_11855 [Loa loa]
MGKKLPCPYEVVSYAGGGNCYRSEGWEQFRARYASPKKSAAQARRIHLNFKSPDALEAADPILNAVVQDIDCSTLIPQMTVLSGSMHPERPNSLFQGEHWLLIRRGARKRTMLDNANSGHPECHSALITHELSQLNIDTAVFSKVRVHKDGSLNEYGAGYTLYWSGKPKTGSYLTGVGFMVKTPSPSN